MYLISARSNSNPAKYLAHGGMIVHGQDRTSFQHAEYLRYPFILFESKRNTVSFRLPIWRVHEEEGMRPVIAPDALAPFELFDVGAYRSTI